MMIRRAFIASLVLAAATAGCNGDDSPTAPPAAGTPPATSTFSEAFTGVLPVQGSSFASFTVSQATTVSITLASLMPSTIGHASATPVRLGLGAPSESGCGLTSSVNATPALTAQLTAQANPATYCVEISDVGNLSAPLNFVIRITQGPPAATAASTVTETVSSFVAIQGATSHSVPLSQAGTISVALTSVTPSTVVGLGVGIPNPGGSGCRLSASLDAAAGTVPQVTVAVDGGTYCVQIFDSGGLTGLGASFSMTITHP